MKKWGCSLIMIGPFLFAFFELFRKHMAKLAFSFFGIEKSTISQSLESQLIIKAEIDVVFSSSISTISCTLSISSQRII